jgi:hypothetical protein
VPSNLFAKQEEFIKTIKKTIEVNANASLIISNQFGKIDLISNDKNEVEILISITVESSNTDKAQKKLDQIEIILKSTSSSLEIKTEIKQMKGNFKGNFQIDYIIKAPPTMPLDLHNQFGDVFISEWKGNTDISVEYGSFTAGKLMAETNELSLEFSKGSVGLINIGEVDLAYTDKFNLDKAKELTIHSSFSNFNIETIEKLNCHSEYDDAEIGEVNHIELDASFSSVEVEKLHISGDLENEYGSLKIYNVGKDFESLDLENSFASIKVVFEKGAQFSFECEAEYGDISVPSGAKISIDKKDHSEHYIKGVYGEGDDLPHVSLEVEYGSGTLKVD